MLVVVGGSVRDSVAARARYFLVLLGDIEQRKSHDPAQNCAERRAPWPNEGSFSAFSDFLLFTQHGAELARCYGNADGLRSVL